MKIAEKIFGGGIYEINFLEWLNVQRSTTFNANKVTQRSFQHSQITIWLDMLKNPTLHFGGSTRLIELRA